MAGWPSLLSVLIALSATPAPEADAGPLTLERAVELALERDERASIAGEQERIANARLWRARAFFFPEIGATANWTFREEERTATIGGEERVFQSRRGRQTNVVASLTLFDARAFPTWRAARRERDAARLDAADVRRGVAFEAADAFLAVLGIQGVREAAERRVKLSEDALRDARARFEAKIVGSNDVTKAELDLANAQRDLTRARGDAEIAREQLGFLVGADVPGELATPDALLEDARKAQPVEADLLAKLDRRPDVLAAKRREEAARAIAWEPIARALPALAATATWRTTNEAGISGIEEDRWLGLTATWEIFDGGERYADRRERKALARIASLDRSATVRTARLAAERARVGLLSAQATLVAAQAAVEAARRNERETTALYEQGLASALEASAARVAMFEAEIALVREEYGLASAFLSVPAALGQDPFGRTVVGEAGR